MSFFVAVQSAIFYFAACTPCLTARQRHRTKQRAKKDREERERLETDQPDTYRHPIPFSVNPYWNEEIQMGPSLPKKGRAASRNTSQRRLTSGGAGSSGGGGGEGGGTIRGGQESSIHTTRSSLAISNSHGPEPAAIANRGGVAPGAAPGSAHAGAGAGAVSDTDTPHPPASPTIVPDDNLSLSMTGSITASSADGWNHKRYQREDEELWGFESSRTGSKLMDAIVKAGSSAGRLLENRLGKDRPITDADRARFYAAPIHPPVNDYHPPIASSKPNHKEALRWMLQPPPSAKVMEGKVPVSRSTSIASSASRRTAPGSNASLSRVMGERMLESKLQRGDAAVDGEKLPALTNTISASRKSTRRTRSQRTRSGSQSTDSEGSSACGGSRRRRRRVPPAVLHLDLDSEDEDYGKPAADSASHALQRPKLHTIVSSDASVRVSQGGKLQRKTKKEKENVSLSKESPTVVEAKEPPEAATVDKKDFSSDPTPIKERPTGGSIDSGLALSA